MNNKIDKNKSNLRKIIRINVLQLFHLNRDEHTIFLSFPNTSKENTHEFLRHIATSLFVTEMTM